MHKKLQRNILSSNNNGGTKNHLRGADYESFSRIHHSAYLPHNFVSKDSQYDLSIQGSQNTTGGAGNVPRDEKGHNCAGNMMGPSRTSPDIVPNNQSTTSQMRPCQELRSSVKGPPLAESEKGSDLLALAIAAADIYENLSEGGSKPGSRVSSPVPLSVATADRSPSQGLERLRSDSELQVTRVPNVHYDSSMTHRGQDMVLSNGPTAAVQHSFGNALSQPGARRPEDYVPQTAQRIQSQAHINLASTPPALYHPPNSLGHQQNPPALHHVPQAGQWHSPLAGQDQESNAMMMQNRGKVNHNISAACSRNASPFGVEKQRHTPEHITASDEPRPAKRKRGRPPKSQSSARISQRQSQSPLARQQTQSQMEAGCQPSMDYRYGHYPVQSINPPYMHFGQPPHGLDFSQRHTGAYMKNDPKIAHPLPQSNHHQKVQPHPMHAHTQQMLSHQTPHLQHHTLLPISNMQNRQEFDKHKKHYNHLPNPLMHQQASRPQFPQINQQMSSQDQMAYTAMLQTYEQYSSKGIVPSPELLARVPGSYHLQSPNKLHNDFNYSLDAATKISASMPASMPSSVAGATQSKSFNTGQMQHLYANGSQQFLKQPHHKSNMQMSTMTSQNQQQSGHRQTPVGSDQLPFRLHNNYTDSSHNQSSSHQRHAPPSTTSTTPASVPTLYHTQKLSQSQVNGPKTSQTRDLHDGRKRAFDQSTTGYTKKTTTHKEDNLSFSEVVAKHIADATKQCQSAGSYPDIPDIAPNKRDHHSLYPTNTLVNQVAAPGRFSLSQVEQSAGLPASRNMSEGQIIQKTVSPSAAPSTSLKSENDRTPCEVTAPLDKNKQSEPSVVCTSITDGQVNDRSKSANEECVSISEGSGIGKVNGPPATDGKIQGISMESNKDAGSETPQASASAENVQTQGAPKESVVQKLDNQIPCNNHLLDSRTIEESSEKSDKTSGSNLKTTHQTASLVDKDHMEFQPSHQVETKKSQFQPPSTIKRDTHACFLCRECFKDVKDIRHHINRAHWHWYNEPYVCKECLVIGKNWYDFQQHVYTVHRRAPPHHFIPKRILQIMYAMLIIPPGHDAPLLTASHVGKGAKVLALPSTEEENKASDSDIESKTNGSDPQTIRPGSPDAIPSPPRLKELPKLQLLSSVEPEVVDKIKKSMECRDVITPPPEALTQEPPTILPVLQNKNTFQHCENDKIVSKTNTTDCENNSRRNSQESTKYTAMEIAKKIKEIQENPLEDSPQAQMARRICEVTRSKVASCKAGSDTANHHENTDSTLIMSDTSERFPIQEKNVPLLSGESVFTEQDFAEFITKLWIAITIKLGSESEQVRNAVNQFCESFDENSIQAKKTLADLLGEEKLFRRESYNANETDYNHTIISLANTIIDMHKGRDSDKKKGFSKTIIDMQDKGSNKETPDYQQGVHMRNISADKQLQVDGRTPMQIEYDETINAVVQDSIRMVEEMEENSKGVTVGFAEEDSNPATNCKYMNGVRSPRKKDTESRRKLCPSAQQKTLNSVQRGVISKARTFKPKYFGKFGLKKVMNTCASFNVKNASSKKGLVTQAKGKLKGKTCNQKDRKINIGSKKKVLQNVFKKTVSRKTIKPKKVYERVLAKNVTEENQDQDHCNDSLRHIFEKYGVDMDNKRNVDEKKIDDDDSSVNSVDSLVYYPEYQPEIDDTFIQGHEEYTRPDDPERKEGNNMTKSITQIPLLKDERAESVISSSTERRLEGGISTGNVMTCLDTNVELNKENVSSIGKPECRENVQTTDKSIPFSPGKEVITGKGFEMGQDKSVYCEMILSTEMSLGRTSPIVAVKGGAGDFFESSKNESSHIEELVSTGESIKLYQNDNTTDQIETTIESMEIDQPNDTPIGKEEIEWVQTDQYDTTQDNACCVDLNKTPGVESDPGMDLFMSEIEICTEEVVVEDQDIEKSPCDKIKPGGSHPIVVLKRLTKEDIDSYSGSDLEDSKEIHHKKRKQVSASKLQLVKQHNDYEAMDDNSEVETDFDDIEFVIELENRPDESASQFCGDAHLPFDSKLGATIAIGEVEDFNKTDPQNLERFAAYFCSICDFSNTQEKCVKSHMTRFHGKGRLAHRIIKKLWVRWQCLICEYTSLSKEDVERHVSKDHITLEPLLECPSCEEKCSSVSSVNDHILMVHQDVATAIRVVKKGEKVEKDILQVACLCDRKSMTKERYRASCKEINRLSKYLKEDIDWQKEEFQCIFCSFGIQSEFFIQVHAMQHMKFQEYSLESGEACENGKQLVKASYALLSTFVFEKDSKLDIIRSSLDMYLLDKPTIVKLFGDSVPIDPITDTNGQDQIDAAVASILPMEGIETEIVETDAIYIDINQKQQEVSKHHDGESVQDIGNADSVAEVEHAVISLQGMNSSSEDIMVDLENKNAHSGNVDMHIIPSSVEETLLKKPDISEGDQICEEKCECDTPLSTMEHKQQSLQTIHQHDDLDANLLSTLKKTSIPTQNATSDAPQTTISIQNVSPSSSNNLSETNKEHVDDNSSKYIFPRTVDVHPTILQEAAIYEEETNIGFAMQTVNLKLIPIPQGNPPSKSIVEDTIARKQESSAEIFSHIKSTTTAKTGIDHKKQHSDNRKIQPTMNGVFKKTHHKNKFHKTSVNVTSSSLHTTHRNSDRSPRREKVISTVTIAKINEDTHAKPYQTEKIPKLRITKKGSSSSLEEGEVQYHIEQFTETDKLESTNELQHKNHSNKSTIGTGSDSKCEKLDMKENCIVSMNLAHNKSRITHLHDTSLHHKGNRRSKSLSKGGTLLIQDKLPITEEKSVKCKVNDKEKHSHAGFPKNVTTREKREHGVHDSISRERDQSKIYENIDNSRIDLSKEIKTKPKPDSVGTIKVNLGKEGIYMKKPIVLLSDVSLMKDCKYPFKANKATKVEDQLNRPDRTKLNGKPTDEKIQDSNSDKDFSKMLKKFRQEKVTAKLTATTKSSDCNLDESSTNSTASDITTNAKTMDSSQDLKGNDSSRNVWDALKDMLS